MDKVISRRNGALIAQELPVDAEPLAPLDEDDQVLRAEGPEDLPSRLVRAGMKEVKAYPDSELELYELD